MHIMRALLECPNLDFSEKNESIKKHLKQETKTFAVIRHYEICGP